MEINESVESVEPSEGISLSDKLQNIALKVHVDKDMLIATTAVVVAVAVGINAHLSLLWLQQGISIFEDRLKGNH
ncbi:MAG: hypothetical protein ABSE04_03705 [Candidatus Microgenomates bacterium]|jgi:hypothetical protein